MAVLDVLGIPVFFLAKIGHIVVDAVLNENHLYDSDITENPVEDGTVYSDNIVLLPVVLEMECRVSDATSSPARLNYPGRSNEAFKELVSLQRKREPISIVTGLNVYQNMLIKSVGFPRSSVDGNSIRFSLVARELLIVGEDSATNRDLIAGDVQHTALPIRNNGEVAKVAL